MGISKFKDPRLWGSIAAGIVAITAGLNLGLEHHRRAVADTMNWPQNEREQLAGLIWSYIPQPIYALTTAGILAVWLLIPEPNAAKAESDRTVVARVARRRLAQSALSDAELLHWSSVLSEMEDKADA